MSGYSFWYRSTNMNSTDPKNAPRSLKIEFFGTPKVYIEAPLLSHTQWSRYATDFLYKNNRVYINFSEIIRIFYLQGNLYILYIVFFLSNWEVTKRMIPC